LIPLWKLTSELCSISKATKESIDGNIGALSRLSLPDNSSCDDDLQANFRGLPELNANCTKEALAGALETWTQIEETRSWLICIIY
jgi:hypothetical protein